MNFAKIMEHDEGVELQMYKDSRGYWTIGIGTLLDPRKGAKISKAAAEFMFNERIEEKRKKLDARIPWWKHETQVRQWAMLSMAYQLGVHGVEGFHDMLAAWKAGDYKTAAAEALDSHWSREQTPGRSKRIAHMIEFDEVPEDYL